MLALFVNVQFSTTMLGLYVVGTAVGVVELIIEKWIETACVERELELSLTMQRDMVIEVLGEKLDEARIDTCNGANELLKKVQFSMMILHVGEEHARLMGLPIGLTVDCDDM